MRVIHNLTPQYQILAWLQQNLAQKDSALGVQEVRQYLHKRYDHPSSSLCQLDPPQLAPRLVEARILKSVRDGQSYVSDIDRYLDSGTGKQQ